MNSPRARLITLVLALIIIFTTGIQAPPALSAQPAPALPQSEVSGTTSSQVGLVIPEKGYFIREYSVPGLIHGLLSDPMGQKIREAMESRSETPTNISIPKSEFLVTNSGDSGVGSLRSAIEQANSNPGPDVIHFSMSSAIISPLSSLPAITDNGTMIDASPNWNGSWPGGEPGITLNGSNISGSASGLLILGASNVTIKGLEIENFSVCIWLLNAGNSTIGEGASTSGGGRMLIHSCTGPAVYIVGGQDNRVVGSYIGTSDNGNLPEPNGGDGITINDSQRNDIGGAGALEGNIIGASDFGIRILGSNAISNTVVANQIGVGMLSGNIANQHEGVYIGEGASYNAVGGRITTSPSHGPYYTCTGIGNEIRNNGGNGVTLTGAGNLSNGIMDNNLSDNQNNGIEVSNQSQEGMIACNNIVNSVQSGIFFQQVDTKGHWISSNFIGIDMFTATNGANGKHGIGLYDGTSDNLVDSNYIGNNGWSGVAIVGADSTKNWLLWNHIGIGKNGESVGNAFYGVDIVRSHDNSLTSNVITHNGTAGSFAGVHIDEDTAVGNGLFMNSIYQNSGAGIQLTNRSQNEIGAPVINSVNCPFVSGIAGPIGARVDIFSDSADEGRYFEGTTYVNSQYQWIYSGRYRGPNLTAIAIDSQTFDSSVFSTPWVGAGECHAIFLPELHKRK